ncbi:MAG TPA: type II secretion system protein [Trueperaceae bacterium]|nr:type II secretion system protein [Trueperaceae bacterium]
MRLERGFTIIELLIALAIIGIAFVALALTEVNNLKASSRTRIASEAKTVATNVLESKVSDILRVDTTSGVATYDDAPTGSPYKSYYFIDYYYACPTRVDPPAGIRSGTMNDLRASTGGGATIHCTGTTSPVTVQDGTVTASWSIVGETGPLGEGMLDITVTATHSAGPSVVLSDRLSCYDVYPSPKIDAPAPCPTPTVSGGGRPTGSG